MTTPEPLAPEIYSLVLATLAKRVKAEQEPAKAVFGHRYPEGHTERFRTPDGTRLGLVQRTDPDPEWRVTGRDALEAHYADNPDAWEQTVEVLLPDGRWLACAEWDELYRVLAEHAEHLVRDAGQRIAPHIEAELIAASARTGQPAAPGITQVHPKGTLRVVPDPKTADAAVAGLHAAGLIDAAGRPVEIEQSTEEAS